MHLPGDNSIVYYKDFGQTMTMSVFVIVPAYNVSDIRTMHTTERE